jgi:type II secretory pathway pseudopilin PulG
MKTIRHSRLGRHLQNAFTQAEMLVSLAVVTLLCAGLVTSVILLQRNFKASTAYVAKEASQMRLLDFLALDLRRALTVGVDNSTGSINLTLPDYYGSDGTPRIPQIANGLAYYGNPANPVSVRYYKANGGLYRQENNQVTTIATDIQDFNVAFRDEGQVIEVSVSFVPTFQKTGGNRAGTTTITRTLLRNKRRV